METKKEYFAFNGGKMQHVFMFENSQYKDTFTSNEAKEAFQNGKYYVKIDGSNGMIMKTNDGNLLPYTRYDIRGKHGEIKVAEGVENILEGMNPSQYGNHNYFYKLVDKNARKKQGKINTKMYDLLETHQDHINDIIPETGRLSIEWVGNKFNKTPAINVDVAFCIHHEQEYSFQDDTKPQNFQEMRNYLLNNISVEGFVLSHNGKFWKIRSNMFDRDCKFSKRITDWVPKVYC